MYEHIKIQSLIKHIFLEQKKNVQILCVRMSGHRGCFYKVLDKHEDVDINSDDYSLGLHIANEHGCSDRGDFNRLYNVQILENCSPSTLEKKEHCYIHKYNTLFPIGLNKMNPFGLPILSQDVVFLYISRSNSLYSFIFS